MGRRGAAPTGDSGTLKQEKPGRGGERRRGGYLHRKRATIQGVLEIGREGCVEGGGNWSCITTIVVGLQSWAFYFSIGREENKTVKGGDPREGTSRPSRLKQMIKMIGKAEAPLTTQLRPGRGELKGEPN